ncbi:hypothetical protein GWK18_07200 [Kocuria sp. JC486]|uniref:hypothetical protein n=1 Tax=Kocuria sp. JC486 TaxID=1970736 RepID=UPI0014201750|nr:hypothetical protein [Kocuria sp. JC486]NHU85379.1 hypothetical protein [Kocuria sp. JC486]
MSSTTENRTSGPIPTWVRVPETAAQRDTAEGLAPTTTRRDAQTVEGRDVATGPVLHGVLEAPATAQMTVSGSEPDSESDFAGPHGVTGRGGARFAVLLVHPVGREHVVSLRAVVALSHELAMRGALVLRIALRGTGDSSAAPEDLAAAWAADVQAGLAELAARSPGLPLTAVGLRMGAAALSTALVREPPSAVRPQRVILWEPVGGRAYLRRAAALRRMSLDRETVEADRGTETAGELYSPAQAASLKRLADPARASLPTGWRIHVESDPESAELLYQVSSEFARVPRTTVKAIADELATSVAPRSSGSDDPHGSDGANGDDGARGLDLEPVSVVRSTHQGVDITETLVRTTAGHPGILTEPADATPLPAETAVLMVSAAAEPADGPTGLWTTCARDLAAHGLTVLRSDRPRCGVSTDPLDDDPPVPYEDAAIDAVADDAHWLAGRTGLPVTGVGLCVGAWLLLRTGTGGNLSRVIAFNNIAWRTGTAFYQRVYREIATWDGAPAGLVPDVVPSDSTLSRAKKSARRFLSVSKARVEADAPAWLWHAIGRTGIVDAPSVVLADPAMPPAVDLILGREDLQRFEQLHGPWALSRMKGRTTERGGRDGVTVPEILLTPQAAGPLESRASGVVLRSVPELDHGLLSAVARDAVRTILHELLVRTPD